MTFAAPLQPGAHAALSREGTTATIGNPDGSVSFVDTRTGRLRSAMGGHTAAVQNVDYSSDGRVVVTTGDGARVIAWDPVTGAQVQQLLGHAGRVTGIAFAADGQALYICALDGTVLVWDLGSSRRFGQRFTAGTAAPSSTPSLDPATPPLAIAPDGSRFAVRIDARHVGIVSAATLREQASFATRQDSPITALAWSPTQPELAVGDEHATVALWRVSGLPHLLRELTTLRVSAGMPEVVQSLSFSASGRSLAASDAIKSPWAAPRGRVIVWRLPQGQVLSGPVNLAAVPNAVAFSRDGRLLGVALADGRLIITDPHSGRHDAHFTRSRGTTAGPRVSPSGHQGRSSSEVTPASCRLGNPVSGVPVSRPVLAAAAPIASVAVDRSGTRIATAGGPGGGLGLWFAPSLQPDGATLDPEPGTWGNAGFTPDGRTLISVTANGGGSAWPIDPTSLAAHACAAGRNFSGEEWSRFVSGYPYSRVCP